MEYLLLLNPGHNRVYLDSAQGAAAAELSALLPGCNAESTTLCNQPAFRLTCEQPLDGEALSACARSSLFYALFQKEGDLLRPVDTESWQYLPDSLNTILKYPGKTNEQFTRMMVNLALAAAQTTRDAVAAGTDGVKFHLLHVIDHTDLAKLYRAGEFEVLSMERYFRLLAGCIHRIPKDMVVHRLTGDGDKRTLIAPLWSGNKKHVLNSMNRYFDEIGLEQGSLFTPH